MDVLKGRDIDRIVILGSGQSILKLNQNEIDFINRCKVVIAVNKFMAFYKKSGILPTHIYYHDFFSKGSFPMFKFILNECITNNLENLTFITNPYFKLIADKGTLSNLRSLLIDILRYRSNPFLRYVLGLKNSQSQDTRLWRELKMIKYPLGSKIVSVKVNNSKWAKSLSERLFHFKGSLTSVLNYVSICYPDWNVFLVGNDFLGGYYFYEDELESLNIDWKDFTYDETKKQGLHYSFQDTGDKMSTRFPLIINELNNTGNKVYCNNLQSLLVLEAGVEFKSLLD